MAEREDVVIGRDGYATNANEASGVWAGRDRAAKQSKRKTA
jgi:hypothetical protein